MNHVFPINSGLTTTGLTTVDFGVDPGSDSASIVIIDQPNIVAESIVRAHMHLEATADHSADEHRIETLRVSCGDVVSGVGFTIYVDCFEGTAYGVFNVAWEFT